MVQPYAMSAERGVLVAEPRISWVNTDVEMAFVPPMSDAELAEAQSLELPNNFEIVDSTQHAEVSLSGTPVRLPATVLNIRSNDSEVRGSYPNQVNQAPLAHAERTPAAIGALTKWWMDKANPDPEAYRTTGI